MHDADSKTTVELPKDLATCHTLIEQERARNQQLSTQHEQLEAEMKKSSQAAQSVGERQSE